MEDPRVVWTRQGGRPQDVVVLPPTNMDHPSVTTTNVPSKRESPTTSTTTLPSNHRLGRIWSAEEAIQAWCRQQSGQTHEDEDDQQNDAHNDPETTSEDNDDHDNNNMELKSLDTSSPARLRLVFCNASPTHELVYSWITPNGTLRGFRPLPPTPRGGNPVVQWLATHFQPHKKQQQQRMDQGVVERSFVGHAFVFGMVPSADLEQPTKKKKKKTTKRRTTTKAHLKNLRDLKDIVVLGAYRPERTTLPSLKRQRVEQEDDNEDENDGNHSVDSSDSDEDEFATHVITLHPPPSPEKCCCDGDGGLRSSPTNNREMLQQEPSTVAAHSSTDGNADWMYYPMDSSWTIEVESVTYSTAGQRRRLWLDTTQTKRYRKTTLGKEEWPVYIDEDCYNKQSNDDSTQEWLDMLASDLDFALHHIPEHAKALLKSHPCCFWINQSFEYGPKQAPEELTHMCFHPGKDWLRNHGMHEQKCHCVEVYNLQEYCGTDRDYWGPGGVLIHELSHAYHYLCLPDGYDNADIQTCYQHAMDQGLYDKVAVHGPQGPTARAYACTNAMEYFAELSTAFLGGIPPQTNHGTETTREQQQQDEDEEEEEYNKWYPFNRSQLKTHDPRAYEMLQKIWKVEC